MTATAESERAASARGADLPGRTPLLRLLRAQAAEPATADEAVADFLAAATPDNTTRTYASAWRGFTAWCAETGHDALPAEPRTVARYLAASARDRDRPVTASTLAVWRAAISRVHVDAGWPDPTTDALVRRVLRGIRRTRTKAGETPRQATAATAPILQKVVAVAHERADTWRQQVAGRRDIAVLVLGYAAALRRSELAGLHCGDITVATTPGMDPLLRIRLRGSKTSQTATQRLYVRRGSDPDALCCPWCAVVRWQAVITAADSAAAAAARRPGVDADDITDAVAIAVQRLLRRDDTDPHVHRCSGPWPAPHAASAPLFRPLAHGGLPRADGRALTGRSVARILAARADAAGVEPLRGHSLRAGAATTAFDNGASADEVMALTRHQRIETVLGYDRQRDQRSADVDTGL